MDALTTTTAAPLVPSSPAAGRLVEAFLAGRSARTLAAYSADLRDFAAFVGAASPAKAAEALLGRGHGGANETALAYRAHLVDRGLAAATVNRRLAAVRSLVRLARTLGMVPWTLEVPSVKAAAYRDTAGPGTAAVRRILDALEAENGPKAARDLALVRLLFDLGLRRGEVVSLDREDLDLDRGVVHVLGKGRTAREPVSLPAPTREALVAWLAHRGDQDGPLFVSLDRRAAGNRLTGTSLYRIVRAAGRRAGAEVRPHGLRHAAITAALDLTGGDVRKVQRFSRHRDLRVLNVYDDNRADLGGEVAALVAGAA